MSIKAFVFDMDGTTLDSLPDLAVITNKALVEMGFPTHTQDEILTYVGNGAERLIEQATPATATNGQRRQTLEIWRARYLECDNNLTHPFPGVVETVETLRKHGVKTAILSNKFDAAVRLLADRFFPNLFDVVRGEIPPTPRKPDPTSLLQILNELGVRPEEAAYVGDTNVDVEVSRNAGVKAIGVSWGYDAAAPMPKDKLDAYIHDPRELLQLL